MTFIPAQWGESLMGASKNSKPKLGFRLQLAALIQSAPLFTIGNIIRVPPEKAPGTDYRYFLRRLVNWGLTWMLPLVSISLSLIPYFVELPLNQGKDDRLATIVELTSTHSRQLLGIALISSLIVIRFHYRRWNFYQKATYRLHMVAHKLRNRLTFEKAARLRDSPYSTSPSGNFEFADLMFNTLNDCADLFTSLVRKGDVSVNILIPVPDSEKLDNDFQHLVTALWSRPTTRTAHRRAVRADGTRVRSRLSIADSIAGEVYRDKISVLVRDTVLGSTALDFDGKSPRAPFESLGFYRSLMCAPIVINARPVFVLTIDCSSPGQFHPEYLDLARMCADVVALLFKIASNLAMPWHEIATRDSPERLNS